MKRLLTIVLAIALTLAATMTCFADTSGNAVNITATVPDPNYTINIPSNVDITEENYGFAVIGAASVENVVHLSDSKKISYVATGTSFTDGSGNTMEATYYTTTEATPSKAGSTPVTGMETGIIVVYEEGQDVASPTKICVGIDNTEWENAAAGEYTATLTYAFSVADSE